MPMRYFRRHWDESRGDAFDAWGPATYFLEALPDGGVTRQVQVYADGHVLAYDELLLEDQFGGLTDQPLGEDAFAGDRRQLLVPGVLPHWKMLPESGPGSFVDLWQSQGLLSERLRLGEDKTSNRLAAPFLDTAL
jgi:hypothetical protein